jgi:type II secretory pathway pseudopilin PulG
MSIKRGDTIIEVMFAITVFCLVSILSVTLMNSGVSTAQSSLELTMARNEIDAQAEALRYIQNSYLAEKNLSAESDSKNDKYEYLWDGLISNITEAVDLASFPPPSCDAPYSNAAADNDHYIYSDNAFIINYRNIIPSVLDTSATIISSRDGIELSDHFAQTPLYPRIIFNSGIVADDDNSETDLSDDATYNQLQRAEGIWIIAAASEAETHGNPEFYDFHIRTCWIAPGRSVPSTIGTIVRLYNPDVIE